jgi:CARDB
MRRLAVTASLLALAGGGAAALAQTQPGQRPPLKVALETCQTGAAPADRYAVFTGSMPTQDKTASMAMRFDLFERTPQAQGFDHVALAKWGIWERTTKAGVPGFIFAKRVDQLAAPAAYRAVVSFRWYDSAGKVLRSERRVSPVCRQPDPRPDLHVKRVTFDSGKAHVVVRNRGRSAAGAFDVSATVADGPGISRTVNGLPQAAQTTLTFPAARCTAGASATITVDPSGAVDEADEADNTVIVPCPQRR